jgi:hypothetical protein
LLLDQALRKSVFVGLDRRRPWKGSLIPGGLIVVGAVSVMVLVPIEQVLLEVGVLTAGLLAGTGFGRFGVPGQWMRIVVLVVFIAANRTVEAPAPWTVDGRGFASAAEARAAAGAVLRALDGEKGGRLSVEHGPARFEVAGAVNPGFICHRSVDPAEERSWAVLVRAGKVADEAVEVPMGGLKGFMPVRIVHDFASVELTLENILRNPEWSSFGPDWETGHQAEGTRLTSH